MTKRTSFKSITLSGAAAWAMILAAAAHAQEGEKRDFDIEAQPLAKALLEFNEQSGVLVMAPQALVEGKTAPAIEGEITADEALDRILSGSGLKSYASDSGAFTITLASAETTDPRPFQIARLQGAPTRRIESVDEGEGDALIMDVIVVTGTNIRGVENPTTPVLQFDREEIELSGVGTVEDFLSTVPQNFGSETVLSDNSDNPFGSGRGIVGQSTVDLRGLGSGSTLILLNGRRMTTSGLGSFVDVSTLPIGVIDRVDVLTDGASAVYGSDAVGGVVNFITRRDYEGFDITARYSTVTDGSKEEYSLGGAGGVNWERGGAFLGVSYLDSTPLLTGDRDFVDLTRTAPDSTFGAKSDRLNIAGSVYQNLFKGLSFHTDFLFSNINSEISQVDDTPITFRSDQDSYFVNSHLDYEVNDKVLAQVFFDYGNESISRTDNRFGPDDFSSQSEFDNSIMTVEGQLSGQLLKLPAGSIDFASGASYREETFEQPGSSVDAERDVVAIYGEVLVPLVGPEADVPLIQNLDLSIAGRYEDYSDFGETFNPKVGLHWRVSDSFALRGSYSESFRAPPLRDIFLPRSAIVFPTFSAFFTAVEPPTQDPRLPAGRVSLLTQTGGNPSLSEETAETWSAGIEVEPSGLPGLSLTANYFNISYKNRIENISFIQPLQFAPFGDLVQLEPSADFVQSIFDDSSQISNFTPLNPVEPSDIQVFVESGFSNLAERDVSGIDFGMRYERTTSIGDFAARLNGVYFTNYEGRIAEGAEAASELNLLYRPIDFRLRGNISWSKDGFTIYSAVNYQDRYSNYEDSLISNDISSWTTIDFTIAYNFGENTPKSILENTRLNFTATNLLDRNPPFVETVDGLNFDTSNANPYGRQLAVSLTKTF